MSKNHDNLKNISVNEQLLRTTLVQNMLNTDNTTIHITSTRSTLTIGTYFSLYNSLHLVYEKKNRFDCLKNLSIHIFFTSRQHQFHLNSNTRCPLKSNNNRSMYKT